MRAERPRDRTAAIGPAEEVGTGPGQLAMPDVCLSDVNGLAGLWHLQQVQLLRDLRENPAPVRADAKIISLRPALGEIPAGAGHADQHSISRAVETYSVHPVAETEIDLSWIGSEMRRAADEAACHHLRRRRRCHRVRPRRALWDAHPYQFTLSQRAVFHVAVHAQRVARAQSQNLTTVRGEHRRGVVGRCLADAHRLAPEGYDEPHVTRIARLPAN